MLIYKYKGDKCLKSNNCDDYSIKNIIALRNYNENLCDRYYVDTDLIRQVFNTYDTFCKFNNTLVNITKLDDNNINTLDFVKNYLENNTDVISSKDIRCRTIYDNLNKWYNNLINNYDSLDKVKWQVVKSMKFYEKLGIFTIASINLKSNYQDFTI